MTRALLPGRWNRHGRAVPDPPPRRRGHGSCDTHGDCDCEFDGDIAPDFYRVIKALPPKPEPNHRARAARWALAIVVTLYLGLAALLRIQAPRFLP